MVIQREISKRRYIAAFFITLGIFILGILLGVITTNLKTETIKQLQYDFGTQLLSLQVQQDLLKEDLCSSEESDSLNEQLINIAERLTSMEGALGKNDERVLSLKEYYSLIEIKHYLFLKDIAKSCNKKYNLIIYFYSNNEDECPDCETQGYVLSYLRTKYDNVKIYSFDANLDNAAIKTLVKQNNMTQVPTVILNDQKYEGFIQREKLESAIA